MSYLKIFFSIGTVMLFGAGVFFINQYYFEQADVEEVVVTTTSEDSQIRYPQPFKSSTVPKQLVEVKTKNAHGFYFDDYFIYLPAKTYEVPIEGGAEYHRYSVANPAGFRALGLCGGKFIAWEYYTDDVNIYSDGLDTFEFGVDQNGNIIANIGSGFFGIVSDDAASFELLQEFTYYTGANLERAFAKDKSRVYVNCGVPADQIDAQTFSVYEDGTISDKNGVRNIEVDLFGSVNVIY